MWSGGALEWEINVSVAFANSPKTASGPAQFRSPLLPLLINSVSVFLSSSPSPFPLFFGRRPAAKIHRIPPPCSVSYVVDGLCRKGKGGNSHLEVIKWEEKNIGHEHRGEVEDLTTPHDYLAIKVFSGGSWRKSPLPLRYLIWYLLPFFPRLLCLSSPFLAARAI